jgi:hypothetical protein
MVRCVQLLMPRAVGSMENTERSDVNFMQKLSDLPTDVHQCLICSVLYPLPNVEVLVAGI